jgi:tRNA pseudouridine55 synthase
MSGFLVVDKPSGITSYDVIRKIKPMLSPKTKIGHSGTLDPFATGLMILGIGKEYTRQLNHWLNHDKSYLAEFCFGSTTNTYDCDGQITNVHSESVTISIPDILPVLESFTGQIKQVPPVFSAKKIKGRPAYDYARQGQPIDLQAAEVEIRRIVPLNAAFNRLRVLVECSKGTYIRSLAHDIGQAMGCGAFLSALSRESIGPITRDFSVDLGRLSSNTIASYLKTTLP